MKPRPQLKDILDAAAHVYGVNVDYIKRDTREGEVVRIRQAVHHIAYNLTRLSMRRIGEKVGERVSSTVIHSRKVVERECELNPDAQYLIDGIIDRLQEEGFDVRTNTQLVLESR
jgi:chromosomal replication initiation ATPase DnaA